MISVWSLQCLKTVDSTLSLSHLPSDYVDERDMTMTVAGYHGDWAPRGVAAKLPVSCLTTQDQPCPGLIWTMKMLYEAVIKVYIIINNIHVLQRLQLYYDVWCTCVARKQIAIYRHISLAFMVENWNIKDKRNSFQSIYHPFQ